MASRLDWRPGDSHLGCRGYSSRWARKKEGPIGCGYPIGPSNREKVLFPLSGFLVAIPRRHLAKIHGASVLRQCRSFDAFQSYHINSRQVPKGTRSAAVTCGPLLQSDCKQPTGSTRPRLAGFPYCTNRASRAPIPRNSCVTAETAEKTSRSGPPARGRQVAEFVRIANRPMRR